MEEVGRSLWDAQQICRNAAFGNADSRSNRHTKVHYFVEKKSKFAFINGTPTGFAVL